MWRNAALIPPTPIKLRDMVGSIRATSGSAYITATQPRQPDKTGPDTRSTVDAVHTACHSMQLKTGITAFVSPSTFAKCQSSQLKTGFIVFFSASIFAASSLWNCSCFFISCFFIVIHNTIINEIQLLDLLHTASDCCNLSTRGHCCVLFLSIPSPWSCGSGHNHIWSPWSCHCS